MEITPELLRSWPLPAVAGDSDKEARGRVMVFAAGAEVAGATVLTATAALRAGAGKLQIAAPQSLAIPLALSFPEARVVPTPETTDGEVAPQAAEALHDLLVRCQAVVVGPGMLDEAAAGALLVRLLESEGPALVADAGAMAALASRPDRARLRAGRLVLTPHAGEMAALCGRSKEEVSADPLGAGRQVAQQLQAVVLVKGATSHVVSPDGAAWRHHSDTPGLGTSGSGDVLAGVIGGLLARGASPAQAAAFGVYAHAQAGARLEARMGRLGFLARELLDEIAPVLNGLAA